jgi:hypothetical protein
MEFAFPALRETALTGFRANDSCKRFRAPAGVIFMPRYVRINRCARSFTRRTGFANAHISGIEASLLRGHANLRMALSVKGVKKRMAKKGELYMWNPFREGEGCLRTLYPDMPPETLLIQHLGINNSVKGGELQRADWFWHRRPKKLILSRDKALWVALLYLLLWIGLAFIPQAIEVIRGIAWLALAAIAVAVFVDICRYAQWKREYYSAISRLIVAATW